MEEGTLRPLPPNPCSPHPCGPNSQCTVVAGQAQCGCLANMIGTAPNCRPECIVSSDCPSNSACINQRCVDPCPGSCSANADCRVVNHSPVCSCIDGYQGDAFRDCRPVPVVGKVFVLLYDLLMLLVKNFFFTEPLIHFSSVILFKGPDLTVSFIPIFCYLHSLWIISFLFSSLVIADYRTNFDQFF